MEEKSKHMSNKYKSFYGHLATDWLICKLQSRTNIGHNEATFKF